MQVQKIDFISRGIAVPKTQKQPNSTTTNPVSSNYSPAFYKDYNINFAARLFRTPANFFEQPFNKNGMPLTMKNYLNEDYEDRQNMPPVQMMKLVFDDINDTENLEQVKRTFSDEPLFDNLTDVPNRKARKGLVSEIEAMKDEFKSEPLFKDGNSNFGLYLVKKIYLEGKNIKEINKDFNSDLNKTYAGLIEAPIDYSTTAAYGIKFPNIGFWKSFVVTRDDFPYEYKPRKISERAASANQKPELTIENIRKGIPDLRPPKFKPTEREVINLTDAVLDKKPDSSLNKLRQKGGNNAENVSFVTKYFSPIMSIALEKVNASDDMREYFQNPENMSKSAKERMDKYWQNSTQMKQLRSLAMKDTIKLFFEAYGADGNNEVFRDLLKYADSIAPDRLEKLKKHDQIQAEYDEMFANLKEEVKAPVEEKIIENKPMDPNEMLIQEAQKQGAEVLSFDTSKGDVKIVCNLNEEFKNKLYGDMKLLPDGFTRSYYNFVTKSELCTKDYVKAVVLSDKMPEEVMDMLLEHDKCDQIGMQINKAYGDKNKPLMIAANQSLVMMINDRLKKEYPALLQMDTSEIINLASDKARINNWDHAEKTKLSQLYAKYTAPMTSKEENNKINDALVNYMLTRKDKPSLSSDAKLIGQFNRLLAKNMQDHPSLKSSLSKLIRQSKFVEVYGGSCRMLLDNNISKDMKDAKAELMFDDLFTYNMKGLAQFYTVDIQNLYECIQDPETRSAMLQLTMKMRL